jgi:hypothetical protein
MRHFGAAVIAGLLAAQSPLAMDSAAARKPEAQAHRPAPGKPAEKGFAREDAVIVPAAVTPAIAASYAGIPETERHAIVTDLAWTGFYNGPGGGEFDDRAVAGLKAFQKHLGAKDTGHLLPEERAALLSAARSHGDAAGFHLIDDPATGTRLGVPGKVTPRAFSTRNGSRWSSAQGQIQIETYRLTEASLPALFEDEKKVAHREIAVSALSADSFVMAGTNGLKEFVERAETKDGEVRGIVFSYDVAFEAMTVPVARAVIASFAGFPDPLAPLPPGMRRNVDYSTGIAVGAHEILAAGEATAGCHSIEVPGLGHAERIAADETSGLAVLRLYGARNLTPAVLDTAANAAGKMTLAGIADPQAQAGGAAISRVATTVSAGGFDPAPPLGFAGAAALESGGEIAGVAIVKPATGAAPAQPALIAADAVRGFLAAQKIAQTIKAQAPDPRPAAPALYRVICVRK